MQQRFVYIWFQYLLTDWMARKKPALKTEALVLTRPENGQVLVAAVNAAAEAAGVFKTMPLADARAIAPQLLAMPHETHRPENILQTMAEWCSRYTPLVTVDPAEGLWLDMTGGTHLFGSEKSLLEDINRVFRQLGYAVRISMADTPSGAWAIARYASTGPIVAEKALRSRLAPLPVEALRLELPTSVRLISLGLRRIGDLYALPRAPLARRLGKEVLLRLDQALGDAVEVLAPFRPPPVLEVRAHVPDGVMVLEGIVTVLKKLLDDLCAQMNESGSGLRQARFQAFLFDGGVEGIGISTSGPSKSTKHLFKLFEEKAVKMNIGFGAESFVLSALQIEPISRMQNGFEDLGDSEARPAQLPELIDRLQQRLGTQAVYRCEPRQSHLPDYPPMMFRYKGRLHRIRHAEGPERIEAEWWRRQAEPRDYYRLEDETGQRYWIFRLGHYAQKNPSRWYLHGFFG